MLSHNLAVGFPELPKGTGHSCLLVAAPSPLPNPTCPSGRLRPLPTPEVALSSTPGHPVPASHVLLDVVEDGLEAAPCPPPRPVCQRPTLPTSQEDRPRGPTGPWSA